MTNIIIQKMTTADIPTAIQILSSVGMGSVDSPELKGINWDTFIVAKMNEEIVGVAGFRLISENVGRTMLMAVPKKYRGLGIGLLLQKHRMNVLFKKGVKTLESYTDRPKTIEWYKKHFGYVEMGKKKKDNAFSLSDVDEWTILETDLEKYFGNENG